MGNFYFRRQDELFFKMFSATREKEWACIPGVQCISGSYDSYLPPPITTTKSIFLVELEQSRLAAWPYASQHPWWATTGSSAAWGAADRVVIPSHHPIPADLIHGREMHMFTIGNRCASRSNLVCNKLSSITPSPCSECSPSWIDSNILDGTMMAISSNRLNSEKMRRGLFRSSPRVGLDGSSHPGFS